MTEYIKTAGKASGFYIAQQRTRRHAVVRVVYVTYFFETNVSAFPFSTPRPVRPIRCT